MSAPRNLLAPAGPAARILSDLGWPLLLGFTVVALALWLFLAYLVVRRRGSRDEQAPVGAGGGFGWLLIGGFVVPGIVFVACFVATSACSTRCARR